MKQSWGASPRITGIGPAPWSCIPMVRSATWPDPSPTNSCAWDIRTLDATSSACRYGASWAIPRKPPWRVFAKSFTRAMPLIVDARTRAEYAVGTIPTAQSILAGEASKAKLDRRLRYLDPNTRIVVFANSAREARGVAEEISRNAYPNSSYFGGTYQQLLREKFFLERKPSASFF